MLSWPCWLIYSGRFTHINGYPSSAASPMQTNESSPVRDRRSTTEPPNQRLVTYGPVSKDEKTTAHALNKVTCEYRMSKITTLFWNQRPDLSSPIMHSVR